MLGEAASLFARRGRKGVGMKSRSPLRRLVALSAASVPVDSVVGLADQCYTQASHAWDDTDF